jgi:CRISPR-associated protein Csh2
MKTQRKNKEEKNVSDLKRTEILFLYDVQNGNPNGDPSDENKPRIDEETKLNIVTDVRLKRTIRDYLFNFKGYNGTGGKDIFVRQSYVNDDMAKGLNDAMGRAKKFGNDPKTILDQCIDIRLFGGVIPTQLTATKKGSITLTGPVQFKMGHSLHRVQTMYIKGTGAFAATAGKDQNTFREEHILPYSMIAFYGIINENAAKHTGLTIEDVELLKEAIWEGTRNLISRSKFEHNPRLLLMLTHNENNFFIGELDKYLSLINNEGIEDEQIRSLKDYRIDMTRLKQKIDSLDTAPKIYIRKDDSLIIEGW